MENRPEIGTKVVANERAEFASGGRIKSGTVCTVTEHAASIDIYFRVSFEGQGERGGLFRPEEFDPYVESEKPAQRKYVDMVHFDALTKIRDAFLTLNATICSTPSGWLEVLDMTVMDESGSPFARVSYVDGDVLVEPLFSLVRDFEDR